MSTDPNLPVELAYEQSIKDDSHVVALSNMCKDLAETLALTDVLNEHQRQLVTQRVATLNETLPQREVDLARKQERLEQSRALKRNRRDQLVVPPDIPIDILGQVPQAVVDVKDLKAFCGTLGKETAPAGIKNFFKKLFQYGGSKRYTYDNYKTALAACFCDELYDYLIGKETETFPEIARWFYRIYHRPEDIQSQTAKLRKFVRLALEPIDIFMDRYQVIATAVDALLPVEQRHYAGAMHRLQVLELAIQSPAKEEYRKWRDRQIEGGFWYSYESSLNKAMDLELCNSCLPTKSISLDCVLALGSRESQKHNSVYGSNNAQPLPDQNANPAIARRGGGRGRAPFVPSSAPPNLDPNKAGSARASFPYSSRGGASDASSTNRRGNRGRKGSFLSGLASSMKPAGRGGSFASRFPGHRGRGGQQRGGQQQQAPQQRPQYNAPTRQQQPLNDQQMPLQSRVPPSYPAANNQPAGRGQGGGNNFRGRGRGYGGNSGRGNNFGAGGGNNLKSSSKINPKWWCVKCGVSKREKHRGDTHTTPYCPFYPHFNTRCCSYCHDKLGIKAHHFPKFCLQMTKEYRELYELDFKEPGEGCQDPYVYLNNPEFAEDTGDFFETFNLCFEDDEEEDTFDA